MEICPLCYTKSFQPEIEGPQGRRLYLCENCKLVFEKRINRPERDVEKDRYLEHDNSINDKGYVQHLNRAIKPVLNYLKPDYQGLDYGCGPVPTLNRLLEKESYNCEFYDPIFFPEPPTGKFDFIFATECFEHFFRPADEMCKLSGLLKPEGILVVMTQPWKDTTKFKSWRYATDPTHVVFYNLETIEFISRNYGFTLLKNYRDRVFILQKK
ncbi:Methyltransferase domain-containing protein [Tangfeifania diversioriginum]|uniref:Methyltransferase domain-containing protein n=1 Tax=Tangfeifania diversioriginum TaxID=1168035 RepID=A0A1M6MN93_9BACT|nr:class I SAM-dependent methyltransferase [Tangfeifania diversioriginum]SHJ84743.1 Methyltransferase domain-containing protein [Tangfeifania diversioriginum]